MKHWTIAKRISIGSATLCLILLGLSTFVLCRLVAMRRTSNAIVQNSLPGIINAGVINSAQAEAAIRLYRLLNASSDEQRKSIGSEINELAQTITDSERKYEAAISAPEDRKNFEDFKAARADYGVKRVEFMEIAATNHDLAMQHLIAQVGPLYRKYSQAGDVLQAYNAKMAKERGQTIDAMANSAVPIISLTCAGGLILSVLVAIFIIRSINRVLHEVAQSIASGSEQTASAAGQVSSSSQSLAEGASEQAASLEETSSSLEEMSSMIKRNADNAEKASELAKQAHSAADLGATDMQTMSSAMEAIQTSSTDISKIIKTIDEIAFQTNILALNAAVEAARAGEAGMGFAVVADEVRNLAQRSAQAAKETAAKIEGAISKTAQGVTICATVAKGLEGIVHQVRQVDELVAEVTAASKEQSQSISQVNVAVEQMDKVTQANAATAEESASAAEELNAQAEMLKDSVSRLVALIEGTKADAGQPARASSRPAAAKLMAAEPAKNELAAKGAVPRGERLASPEKKPAVLNGARPMAAGAVFAS